MINTCTKFEFNPSTSYGSYDRHRHHLLHGARSTTDTRVWNKHTTGELKMHHLKMNNTIMSSSLSTCSLNEEIIFLEINLMTPYWSKNLFGLNFCLDSNPSPQFWPKNFAGDLIFTRFFLKEEVTISNLEHCKKLKLCTRLFDVSESAILLQIIQIVHMT